MDPRAFIFEGTLERGQDATRKPLLGFPCETSGNHPYRFGGAPGSFCDGGPFPLPKVAPVSYAWEA